MALIAEGQDLSLRAAPFFQKIPSSEGQNFVWILIALENGAAAD